MPRKKPEKKTNKIPAVIDQYTERAMAADIENEPIPPTVYLPPAIRGKKTRVAYQASNATPVDIRQSMARITMEVDPIGQLSAIANGQPVAFFEVNEKGETTVAYATASMTQRISLLRYLGDKVLPKISMTKDLNKKPDESWSATIENAAERE